MYIHWLFLGGASIFGWWYVGADVFWMVMGVGGW